MLEKGDHELLPDSLPKAPYIRTLLPSYKKVIQPAGGGKVRNWRPDEDLILTRAENTTSSILQAWDALWGLQDSIKRSLVAVFARKYVLTKTRPPIGEIGWCTEEISVLKNFKGDPEMCLEILLRAGYVRTPESVKRKIGKLASGESNYWTTDGTNDLMMYLERWRRQKTIQGITGQKTDTSTKKDICEKISEQTGKSYEAVRSRTTIKDKVKRADPWYPTEEHLLAAHGMLARLPGRSQQAKVFKIENRQPWSLVQDRELLSMARRFELDWEQIQNHSRNNKTVLHDRSYIDMRARYVELAIGLPLAKTRTKLKSPARDDAVPWTDNEKMKLCNALREFWEKYPDGIQAPEGRTTWAEFAAATVHTRNADQCKRKYNEFLSQIKVNVPQTVENLLKLLPAS